jgi:putative membrane protein
MFERLKVAAIGACMGFADAIPGVSGGTMALILGIYQRFISALSSLGMSVIAMLFTTAFWKELFAALKPGTPAPTVEEVTAAQHIAFLINLAVGLVAGLLLGVLILPTLMETYPESMRAFFFGLVFASIVVPYQMMTERKLKHGLLVLLTAVATFYLMGMQQQIQGFSETTVTLKSADGKAIEGDRLFPVGSLLVATSTGQKKLKHETAFQPKEDLLLVKGEKEWTLKVISTRSGKDANIANGSLVQALDIHGKKYSVNKHFKVTHSVVAAGGFDPALWYVFVCGAIAICAMMLPGVSGAFLLLMLGLYGYILHALRDLLFHGDTSGALPVGVFMIGIVGGLIGFSRLLKWLMAHSHNATMAVLTGLMVGSLRALWPFQEGVGHHTEKVLPTAFDAAIGPLIMLVVGVLLVTALNRLGKPAGH